MGMPINSENRRQIAADGTIFEVLDDGTIKRIGKLSDDGNFEPFREQKNWNCPRCGTENESGYNFCGKCGAKKSEAKPEVKTVQQPKYEEEKQESTKKKFKPLQFVGGLILVFVGFCLLFGIPMYKDYCKKSRTAEVVSNLIKIVKFQILSREDPNVMSFSSNIQQLGFKTKKGIFVPTPGHCDLRIESHSPNTPYPYSVQNIVRMNEYECGESYAYAVGAPKVIECDYRGVGNFVWAVAINQDEVPEDWWCVCMDDKFTINHGRCY